jgi:hypothetical protein
LAVVVGPYRDGGRVGPCSIVNEGNFDMRISISVNGTTFAVDPELDVTRGVG